jgi:2-C-methyl-D-erythritol 4-phosphate cytidylyltransferase
MKKIAIIVAGGSGTRMGTDLPKQFLSIEGKPVFLYSIDAFLHAYDDMRIILVMPASYCALAQSILEEFHYPSSIEIVEGGKTRFHSVKNGLDRASEDSLIFIHDAVRCLATPELIRRCGTAAAEAGSAIPVIPVRDSIRRKDDASSGSAVVPREGLFIVQTPQVFVGSVILPAFALPYDPGFTDEASVLEAAGRQVNLVQGEEGNTKITFPDDLAFAAWKLSLRKHN